MDNRGDQQVWFRHCLSFYEYSLYSTLRATNWNQTGQQLSYSSGRLQLLFVSFMVTLNCSCHFHMPINLSWVQHPVINTTRLSKYRMHTVCWSYSRTIANSVNEGLTKTLISEKSLQCPTQSVVEEEINKLNIQIRCVFKFLLRQISIIWYSSVSVEDSMYDKVVHYLKLGLWLPVLSWFASCRICL